jgi:hypothetical protein
VVSGGRLSCTTCPASRPLSGGARSTECASEGERNKDRLSSPMSSAASCDVQQLLLKGRVKLIDMSLTDFGIAICQTKWTWMELFYLYKESYRAICTWKLQRSCWTLDDVSVIYAYLSIISNMDNLSVERVWLISNRRSSLFVLEFLSLYSNVHLIRNSLSGKLCVVMQTRGCTISWLCGSKSLGNYAILRNWVVWI